jgi:hypothetical protein
MGDAGCRHPGRFDDHLDFRVCASLGTRGYKRGFRDPRWVPAHRSTGGTSPLGVEIGDNPNLDACHPWYLRQKHRAELAGAD